MFHVAMLTLCCACDAQKPTPASVEARLRLACAGGESELPGLHFRRVELSSRPDSEAGFDNMSPSGRFIIAYCFQDTPVKYLYTAYEGMIEKPIPLTDQCDTTFADGRKFCPPATDIEYVRVLSNQTCRSMSRDFTEWSLHWDFASHVTVSDLLTAHKALEATGRLVWIPVNDECWLEVNTTRNGASVRR